MKRKRLWYVLLSVAAVLATGAALLWWWMGQPLYHPGDVRSARVLTAPLDPPAQQPSGGVWAVEPGITLRYFASGAGRNVVFVHGGPGFPVREPYPGLERLSNRFRFYYYDQRGCGGSTRPFDRFESRNYGANMTRLERTLGLGAQIADIERIRRILGDERLIVVGHSWGGLLAALYAAEFPERVAALVLIAPATMLVMPNRETDLFETIRRKMPEARRAAFDSWRKDYFDFGGLFTKNEKQLAGQQSVFAGFYIEVTHAAAPGHLEDAGGWMVWAQYLSMGRRHDWRPALAAVTAPVLVVHGANDLQPESASRAYVTALPNARLESLQGCGHFPQSEAPEAFARAVGDFLSRRGI